MADDKGDGGIDCDSNEAKGCEKCIDCIKCVGSTDKGCEKCATCISTCVKFLPCVLKGDDDDDNDNDIPPAPSNLLAACANGASDACREACAPGLGCVEDNKMFSDTDCMGYMACIVLLGEDLLDDLHDHDMDWDKDDFGDEEDEPEACKEAWEDLCEDECDKDEGFVCWQKCARTNIDKLLNAGCKKSDFRKKDEDDKDWDDGKEKWWADHMASMRRQGCEPSACEEYARGAPDEDCCAMPDAGYCKEGYTYSAGEYGCGQGLTYGQVTTCCKRGGDGHHRGWAGRDHVVPAAPSDLAETCAGSIVTAACRRACVPARMCVEDPKKENCSGYAACKAVLGKGSNGGKGKDASPFGRPGPCSDKIMSDGETAIDCGGGVCGPCEAGKGCAINADCLSAKCDTTAAGGPRCVAAAAAAEEPTCAKDGKTCKSDDDCCSNSCAQTTREETKKTCVRNNGVLLVVGCVTAVGAAAVFGIAMRRHVQKKYARRNAALENQPTVEMGQIVQGIPLGAAPAPANREHALQQMAKEAVRGSAIIDHSGADAVPEEPAQLAQV